MSNQKRKDNTQQFAKSRTNGVRDQFNNPDQLVDQDEEEDEDKNYMVLNVEGEEENSKPYYMEGFINGNRFKTVIDSGSPVTIFALDEIKSIMKRDKLQVREMIKGKKYVDFNGKQLNLLGYVFCQLQVGDQFIKKARILVTSKGSRSIIGRQWLSMLRYKFEPVIESKLEENSIEKDEELCEETKKFASDFKNLFTRNGKVKNPPSKN